MAECRRSAAWVRDGHHLGVDTYANSSELVVPRMVANEIAVLGPGEAKTSSQESFHVSTRHGRSNVGLLGTVDDDSKIALLIIRLTVAKPHVESGSGMKDMWQPWRSYPDIIHNVSQELLRCLDGK